MGFIKAIRTCLGKYATFSGRAQRSEFWWFALFVALGLGVCTNIDIAVFGQSESAVTETSASYSGETTFAPFSWIFILGLLVPYIAVGARRMHDIDRNGLWLLLGFIPLIGSIILIVWFAMRGTRGDNRFGADPLGDGPDAV